MSFSFSFALPSWRIMNGYSPYSPPINFLLQEDGFNLLQEDGSKIGLEQ
jgi:hypothetical protein